MVNREQLVLRSVVVTRTYPIVSTARNGFAVMVVWTLRWSEFCMAVDILRVGACGDCLIVMCHRMS